MKKLLIVGCALGALALATSAQAAPAKNSMCSVPAGPAAESWADHYNCWGWTYGSKPAVAPAAHVTAKKDPMCSVPAGPSLVGWNERYSCWK